MLGRHEPGELERALLGSGQWFEDLPALNKNNKQVNVNADPQVEAKEVAAIKALAKAEKVNIVIEDKLERTPLAQIQEVEAGLDNCMERIYPHKERVSRFLKDISVAGVLAGAGMGVKYINDLLVAGAAKITAADQALANEVIRQDGVNSTCMSLILQCYDSLQQVCNQDSLLNATCQQAYQEPCADLIGDKCDAFNGNSMMSIPLIILPLAAVVILGIYLLLRKERYDAPIAPGHRAVDEAMEQAVGFKIHRGQQGEDVLRSEIALAKKLIADANEYASFSLFSKGVAKHRLVIAKPAVSEPVTLTASQAAASTVSKSARTAISKPATSAKSLKWRSKNDLLDIIDGYLGPEDLQAGAAIRAMKIR
jgi:hypothetical protein